MHERSEQVARIFFFVAGGLAGAGAALLLAPQARRAGSGRVGRRLRRAAREARALRDVRPRDGEHRPLPAVAS